MLPGLDPLGTANRERRTAPSSSPQAPAAPGLGKNTSREKMLKAFVISTELSPSAGLWDLHS